jgi:hypothetical protein
MTRRDTTATAGASSFVSGSVRHRDTIQLLHVVARPHLGTQVPQAHLHERVVQVDEHHVVPPLATSWSKVMGRITLRERMLETIEAA